jgi:hypothetical protein
MHNAKKRKAKQAAAKAKYAAQKLSSPIVSDANHDARLRGADLSTAIRPDPLICNPVQAESLATAHQTENPIPERRINANAESVTIRPNRNGPLDGTPLRFVRKEVLAAARRQADILAMVIANNNARMQRVIVVPINRSVALRLGPAMNLAANAIASDANYAADDISPPITPDDDALGFSEDDVVPHPDTRHGRNV